MFYLPSIGSRQEIEQGMAGLRNDLYQKMLGELTEQAQAADQLGYDSISFTEHHFHIEGFELSTNPIMLDLYLAMQTERIRVGQLGIVLPAHNPIRVAEDIAMLDQMTGGRAVAGFARGYQRRWVDTMAQQLHGVRPGMHDEMNQANHDAFEEHWEIIKQAWTQDMLQFSGKGWQIPPPETPWRLDATKQWGAGVENDIVTAVGVVPKPAEAAPAGLPALRIERAHDPLVRAGGRHGSVAAHAARDAAQSLRHLSRRGGRPRPRSQAW